MIKQLFKISGFFIPFCLLAISSLLFVSGCSKESSDDGKSVVSVNEERISLEAFQREIAIRSKQDPSFKITPLTVKEQLDTAVDRKLMIQEAMKMGLANNEDFARTIQVFWEQTLIRELIEAKNQEWKDRLFVTEQEVHDYYNRINEGSGNLPPLETLYDQIKRSLLEQKQTAALEEWLAEVRERADIEINSTLVDGIANAEDQTLNGGGEDGR